MRAFMSEPFSPITPPWDLLLIVAVDRSRRVQCQCKGCGQSIYASIHVVQLATGEIQCWGGDCYKREAGLAGVPGMKPRYSESRGQKLTDEERELLSNNRSRLIAEFKQRHEEARRAEETLHARAEALRRAEVERQEDARQCAADESRRWRDSPAASISVPTPTAVIESEKPARSIYDFAPRKCIFCGQITSEWWTNVGADECKCNLILDGNPGGGRTLLKELLCLNQQRT